MDNTANFPIDLVYLWVDGNDPVWRAKKEKYIKNTGVLHKDAKTNARFRDNDELKYSLRSVRVFAPWVNHIFIVTDGQIPKWLNTKHPKISIIDHRHILPDSALPTFNSCAIESCLDNIPGLSEHFLYANDDVMFGRYHKPDDFFDASGNPINVVKIQSRNDIWKPADFSKKSRNKVGLYGKQLMFIRKLIFDKTGKKYYCSPSHNLEPLRKSYFTKTKYEFFGEFSETLKHRFRKAQEFQWFVHILYNNTLGRNKLVLHKNYREMPEIYEAGDYRGFNKKSILRFIQKLFCRPWYLTMDGRQIADGINKYSPALFCINDTDTSDKTLRQTNREFLESYFPNKSEFEM
jgi:hypothetical protein